MLPDFVGIGAPRSGTTWIYEMLKRHPQVCMSSEKELNFFNNAYQKGAGWYERFFNPCDQNKTVGEFSPSYLADERVPERMKALVPEAKLVISLRNPVKQIFSRYCYMVSRQLYNKPFDCALKENSHLIEQAFYFQHITRFLKYYDRSQLLILIYEDLERDPHSFLREIYSFLKIDSTYVPSNFAERIHFTRMPRSRYLEACVVMIRKGLRVLRLFSLVALLKESNIVNMIRSLNTKRAVTFENVDPKTRSELNDIFAQEKKMLSALLDRKLSVWS